MPEQGEKALIHTWHQGERTITFTWIGIEEVVADRVYALAFTREGKMLLVTDHGEQYWLPGGGVEAGETAEAALARELFEEAAASIKAWEKLGTQVAEDETEKSYQTFFWCRITLAESFNPRHEITKRRLIKPGTFLDTLFWGRHDPKAEILLAKALEREHSYRQRTGCAEKERV